MCPLLNAHQNRMDIHAVQNIELSTCLTTLLRHKIYTLSLKAPYRLVNKYYPREQKTFGEKLRAARIEAGFPMKELAAELGVSRDSVANWEKGRAFPCIRYLRRLEDTFGHIFGHTQEHESQRKTGGGVG